MLDLGDRKLKPVLNPKLRARSEWASVVYLLNMNVLSRLGQKTRTWRSFTSTKRWLLLQALLLLPLISSLLRLLGFNRTYALLSCLLPQPTDKSSQLLNTVDAVRIAAKYHAWATCLRKSLTLWFLLRQQGVSAELKIGTRFEQGEFQAHAWVEYRGNAVGDRQNVRKYFTVFYGLKAYLENQKSLEGLKTS